MRLFDFDTQLRMKLVSASGHLARALDAMVGGYVARPHTVLCAALSQAQDALCWAPGEKIEIRPCELLATLANDWRLDRLDQMNDLATRLQTVSHAPDGDAMLLRISAVHGGVEDLIAAYDHDLQAEKASAACHDKAPMRMPRAELRHRLGRIVRHTRAA